MNKVIHFETFDVINKTIYAQLLWADILISINTESNQVKIVSMNNKHHFKHSVAKENKMYFADNLGHILMLHDTETNDEKLFELGCDEKSNNNIAAMEICDNNVFVISQYKGIICIFDTINEEMKNDYSLNRLLTEWYGDKIDFAIRSWRICDSLYFYITAGNIYENFRYDLHTMRLEHIHSKCLSGKIMASYCFENKLYILKNDFDLTIWNTTNDIAEEIAMEDVYRLNDEIKCKNRFSTVAVTKRNIWLFPAGENKDIYVYDFDKKCGRIYDEYPLDFSYTYVKNWSKYADIKERNGCIY